MMVARVRTFRAPCFQAGPFLPDLSLVSVSSVRLMRIPCAALRKPCLQQLAGRLSCDKHEANALIPAVYGTVRSFRESGGC